MNLLKKIYNRYLSKVNKYGLVIILFLIITFIIGDSNIYKRYAYDEKIRMLENEIKEYRKEIEVNRKKLEDLHTNQERLERFAREEYLMKKQDEDLFIIPENNKSLLQ
jgi:cell division protein FtsB